MKAGHHPHLSQQRDPPPAQEEEGPGHIPGTGPELLHDGLPLLLGHVPMHRRHGEVGFSHLLRQPVHLQIKAEATGSSGRVAVCCSTDVGTRELSVLPLGLTLTGRAGNVPLPSTRRDKDPNSFTPCKSLPENTPLTILI